MKIDRQACKDRRWDIMGIGSPLLDVVIGVDDAALDNLHIAKGSTTIISEERSRDILKKFDTIMQGLSPGGSAANTIAGAATLGNRAAFLGVVGDDEYGRVYREKLEKGNVTPYLSLHRTDATGHSIIFVTPDGERTMVTHLGAASNFAEEHIRVDEIRESRVLHIEAYQLELPNAYGALMRAIQIAEESDTVISLDLSDAGLVRRNRVLFERIVKEHVDVVFANEEEATAFTGKSDPIEALCELRRSCNIAAVKLGAKGSLIGEGADIFRIDPHRVDVVNTNGAGDMYAAGILHGLVNGLGLRRSGEIASHVSALVASSPGARLDERHIGSINGYKKL